MTPRSLAAALCLTGLSVSSLVLARAPESRQTPTRPIVQAEPPTYMDGSVWVLEYSRTKEGATARYLDRLADDWRALLDQAVGEGLVLSYKVFLGTPADRRDWDVMTLIEVRNMAALDGLNVRLGVIATSPAGRRRSTGAVADLSDLREVLGTRIVREALLRAPR